MPKPTTHTRPGAAEPSAQSRPTEAALWWKQVNRRSYDSMRLPRSPDYKVAALQALLDEAQNKIAELERSTSWRVTAPLRWVKELTEFASSRKREPLPPAPPVAPYTLADYQAWVADDEAACQAAIRPASIGATTTFTPRLVMILTTIGADEQALAATLEPLRGQIIPPCSLVATCETMGPARNLLERVAASEPGVTLLTLPNGTTAAEAKAAALARVETEFVCFLDPPDQLAPAAIRLICETIALNPDAELIFADEDRLDISGQRTDPFFKPDWDPELHLAGDLLGRLIVLRDDTLRQIDLPRHTSNTDWFREFSQRAAALCRPDRIHHIPAILSHQVAGKRPIAAEQRWKPVRHPLPSLPPFVTVLVPTRNRADLLRTCADGLLNKTDYPRMELLIIDNDTTEPEAVELLRDLKADQRVRVLAIPGPFNWSAFNNAGAEAARGDILVLLNNDIAVLQSDWLQEMVSHALRPEIGAVGAKLLYPDGTLQHAGVVIDIDTAAKHILRRAPADTDSLGGVLQVTRSVSAVTGACLAVRRDTFFEVGGLDESLAVACNDVDFCLRLRAHGYRNVCTPFAVLEHHEMASRGPDSTPAMRARAAYELNRLSRDWGNSIFVDPYLNPNLVLMEDQPRILRKSMMTSTMHTRLIW